jgi:hypothetical protein
MTTHSDDKVRRYSFAADSESTTDGGIGADRVESLGAPNSTFSAKSTSALGYPDYSDEDASTLIYSTDFAPSVGDTERYTANLASGLAGWNDFRKGKRSRLRDVTVVTPTPRGKTDDSQFPFRVVREPSLVRLFALIRSTDFLIVIDADIFPIAVGLLLRKIVAVEHVSYLAVCPARNYYYQPDGTSCVGHFENGNYSSCYRCQRVETSRTRSICNLFLAIPRRWLLERVSTNIALTPHTARRLALPRTITIIPGVEDPLDRTFRPN